MLFTRSPRKQAERMALPTGVANAASSKRCSRIGATAPLPLGKHQSIKVSYSDDLYVRFGGAYRNLSAAWQYSWLGRPQ